MHHYRAGVRLCVDVASIDGQRRTVSPMSHCSDLVAIGMGSCKLGIKSAFGNYGSIIDKLTNGPALMSTVACLIMAACVVLSG